MPSCYQNIANMLTTITIKKNSSVYGAEGKNITKKEIDSIKSMDNIDSLFITLFFEKFVDAKTGRMITVENYNRNMLDLYKLKLEKGRYPSKENETVVFNINNNYSIGDNIYGNLYYETNDNGTTNIHNRQVKLKVVGILDNKLMRYTSKDMCFANLNNDLIPDNSKYFKVFINYKSKYSKLENETNKLIGMTGINPEKINFNRDISQTTMLINNKKMDNPRFKNLVIAGIMFSLVTMIIYSKKRINDMKLLRIVGGSKKQVMLLLSSEGVLITVSSILIGTILGLILTFILINNINYTLASPELFRELPKDIHYDIYFSLYTLRIVLLPVIIAFIYQLLKTNSGMAKNRKFLIDEVFDKITRTMIFNKTSVMKKISNINFRKYILYLIVPVILLGFSISNYIYVKNGYEESYSNESQSGISTMFAHRKYEINKYDYYVPDFGFTNKDVDSIRKINIIRNVMPINSSEIIYVSKGGEFNPPYSKSSTKNEEYKFSLLSFNKDELTSRNIIYNEQKSQDNYPKVFLKDKFYIRGKNGYENIYINIKTGDLITVRIPEERNGVISYKNVEVKVSGFVDAVKLRSYIRNQELIACIYMEPEQYKKLYGNMRYNSIFFDSDDNREDISEKLRKIIGNEYAVSYINSIRNEGNGEKQVFFEIITNLIYTGFISIFTIFSSLKIILLMRRDEDEVLWYIGASKSVIRKMYIVEGIKYGLISSLITLSLATYKIIDDYLYLKNAFNNTNLYINYSRLFLLSFIPFVIFFICYIVATVEKNEVKRTI